MLLTLAFLAGLAHAQDEGELKIPYETYTLPNGLNVILHEDHRLPQVVVNTWYGVGAKDELKGRTGFAHLFEHLMFMGTTRLPGSGFDDLMEAEGGWNNAWTSEDATDYYDVGPSQLVDTFLWMEADRMDGLSTAMTQDKLDLQREVVRNERRQTHEDAPYGVAWLELPTMLYPEGHPYAHSVIGSHEDLMAAEVSDVVNFFNAWYVPNNASLVVAGDFDSERVKGVIAAYFGGIEAGELPERPEVATPDGPVKAYLEVPDQVDLARSMIMWHSPKSLTQEDAVFDIVASVLSGGRSSRFYKRMIDQDQSAVSADAGQLSQMLSSLFMVDLMPAEGHTLEELEAAAMEEIAKLAEEGPTAEEMERVLNQIRVGSLYGLESLQARASTLNRYHYLVGDADYLATDLERYAKVTPEDVKKAAAALTMERAARLHVVPEAQEEGQ